MSVAFLDSAARTANSQDGDVASDECFLRCSVSRGSTFVRTRSLRVSYYNVMVSFMRFLLLLTAVTAGLCAAEDPDVLRARLGIERLRALVEAGALPRAQLEQAEDNLADAQDMAILRRNMYINDLTESQAGEMVAAARRRLDRRQKKLEQVRSMIDAGLAAKADLGSFQEQVDYAQKEYDLPVSRANLSQELAELARAEQNRQPAPAAAGPAAEVRYDGDGAFSDADFQQLETAFQHRFSKPLPVSALGDTAAHRALGFDHRGRVDVALNPDQPEGIWLRQYLEARRIPYFAFWHAVPGKATGAHIHIGPESTRLAAGSRAKRGAGAD